MKISNQLGISIILGVIFFTAGFLTLPHYGINWDSINHLPRGQAYLHYFLTGNVDYSDLPKWEWYYQNPSSLLIDTDLPWGKMPERSLYQSDAVPFSYFVEYDDGHPPLSDILSSVFNLVFFQKLKLVNDIDSYRMYGIFLVSALVGLIFWWGSKLYGKLAGFLAVLSLVLYPLLFSEAHFNSEKDIPETVFWTFTLFCIWRGVTAKSWQWLMGSGIFLGLALGTKFNILFSIFIILPWVVVALSTQKIKPSIKLIISALLMPLIGFLIFFISWPYLWADPIGRINKIIKFYKTIGLTQHIDSRFLGPLGINTYPIQWILYTTPIIILLLMMLGILVAIWRLKDEKEKSSLLLLLWLIVPIFRITLPNTTVYGGIRQIMEYIPALALLAGLGGSVLVNLIVKKLKLTPWIAASLVILLFVPLLIKLIQIHPNENVYFNPLIGGLSGARDRNLPAWGNTFGAAYRQGIVWLNKNAQQNAKIAFARELLPNVPSIWVRPDLILHNSFRSGFFKRGEYVIGLTYEGTNEVSYFDRYLERFLIPVYQVQVDNVPILKIWKNDLAHTRPEFVSEKQLQFFKFFSTNKGVKFDFFSSIKLSKIEADFTLDDCKDLKQGDVKISENGLDFKKLPGKMPKEDWNVPAFGDQPSENRLLIPFAADQARFVEINISPPDACLKNIDKTSVFFFPS